MECLKNRGRWEWGGAGSKLVEFEVDEGSGGQRILVSSTGVYMWLANMGEERV